MENHLNPVCHVGTHWITLTEHSQMSARPYARVSVIFHDFCIILFLPTWASPTAHHPRGDISTVFPWVFSHDYCDRDRSLSQSCLGIAVI